MASTEHSRLSEPAYHREFVARYDNLRPEPPTEVLVTLAALVSAARLRLVVDLGCGTGISTVVWAGRANRIIGIDQNAEMLAAAREAPLVEYRHARAEGTGLPNACADLVTCAQSFHWMEPRATIAEIARILKTGGVFATYDYDWPPLVDWEVDAAFLAMIEASGVNPTRPEKERHLERLRASGRFRWVREYLIHGRQSLDSDQICLLPLTFGPIARRLNEGATPEQLGLDRFRATVKRRSGEREISLWWSYRVRCARK